MANRYIHSFAVGESYRDLIGTYKVISINENRLTYDYGNGIPQTGDAETKWRIYRNNFLSKQSPPPTPRSSKTLRSANEEKFWDYNEVAPIFAEIITAYGKRHKDFMTHENIVTAFMAHPEGKRILDRPHDERPNQYWVGVMVQPGYYRREVRVGRCL